ncbi:MBL fold metallo-hydrolase [Lysinibacillus agricola]|uniref:MBL fold metallo-hydrolase n=1 Tax=Lysinibacillus agricola TaxID=2590012 RepID=A0ABX7APH1_9BACI|nr:MULTISPECIES: MBL fold metallo-hydrolase [Lysinibacillus]KOS64330.1 metallo-beta-lactamase [Lysinibacillus sp. FJAT-14222]QQP11851.1 MBL fold metallo-hydrolase [Lysinibacillus agricola]
MKYIISKRLKIIIVGLVLIIIASIFVYYQFLAPSADIQQYKEYYAPKTTQKTLIQDEVKVTFLGTSSLLFDDGNTQLMIDGFISRPPLLKMLPLSTVKTDADAVNNVFHKIGIDHNKLRGLFIAHTHYDHALDLAYIAKQIGTHVYGSESAINIGLGEGINVDQMSVYEVNKTMQLGDFTVTVLQSKHSPTFDEGEKINEPLKQPAIALNYHEDSSYDFLITHHNKKFFVKPSANYIEGALDDIRADVLFLGIGVLGAQDENFQNMYYEQTVRKIQPKLIIPIHWDNFTKPLTDALEAMPKFADNTKAGLDFIIQRTKVDKIDFQILQGFQSIYF